jgi:hypothetical protein
MNDAHRALPRCSSLMTMTLCLRPVPPRTMSAMMGRQTADQAQLSYEFCLEDRVASNHLLRRIKVFVRMALALERRGVENVPTETL